jgi:hypothetical protein
MISKPVIKSLVARRLGDSKVLLKNRRYPAAIYLCGYALELALKYRICRLMKFDLGFPENKTEFDLYYSDTRKIFLRSTIRELRDIRHHKLPVLLRYSGEQVNIESHFPSEWNYVKDWNPEMRYVNQVIRKQRATDFMRFYRYFCSGKNKSYGKKSTRSTVGKRLGR